jgi:RNA polymerase sigma-70 factor, ECF subfamily
VLSLIEGPFGFARDSPAATKKSIKRLRGLLMLAQVDQSFDILLERARAGDAVALGHLLESTRAYLKVVAGFLMRNACRAPVDISDVVQETNLRAHEKFSSFDGSSEGELVGWLRKILNNHVLNILKSQGRFARRPQSLETLLERASAEAHGALAAQGSTPSAQASRREQAVLVANALESLPPDYKQVLVLCYVEKVSHEEAGRPMGRSETASRMLLMRAARALEKRLREQS